MGFMHNQLGDVRSFRLCNVIYDYNPVGLGLELDLLLPSARVIRTIDRVMEWRGKLGSSRCDNGGENISGEILNWPGNDIIRINHTQPGKPQQNGYIGRYNRTVR